MISTMGGQVAILSPTALGSIACPGEPSGGSQRELLVAFDPQRALFHLSGAHS